MPEKPEKAIYRIYRDTRFSKDKTPYKTHIGGDLQHRRIPKNAGAGFYVEISHDGSGSPAGCTCPGLSSSWPCDRRSPRSGSSSRSSAPTALVKALGPLQGEQLARVPKGVDPESPAAEWLRYKQFYYFVELPAKTAKSPTLYKEVLTRLKPLLPLNQFLNHAIAALGEGDDARPIRPEPMF